MNQDLKKGGSVKIRPKTGLIGIILSLWLLALIVVACSPGNNLSKMDKDQQPQWVATFSNERARSETPTLALNRYVLPATGTVTPVPSITPTRTQTSTPTRAATIPTVATIKPYGQKRIVVNLSQQILYAYQDQNEIYRFIVSSGANNITPISSFKILEKIDNAYSNTYRFWMPHWMGFTWAGKLEDGFHALPVLPDGKELWSDKLGQPVTSGCIVLRANDAHVLYNWTDVGTPVDIQY